MGRPPYSSLPVAVQRWAGSVLGSPIVSADSESGGFSPGVAARVRCASGRRAFLKAVSAEVNPHSPELHRAEARVTAVLPASLGSPPLLGCYDDGTWVALLLEEVLGRPPTVPWLESELAAALRVLDRLSQVPAPAGLPSAVEALTGEFGGWQLLAADPPSDLAAWQVAHLDELVALEAGWPEAVTGDTLLHLDARGDNMLVRPDGEMVLVDWPWAAGGSAVMDVVGFVPSAMLDGAGDPEVLLSRTGVGRAAEPERVTTLVAAFSGLMEWASRRPPMPGVETVRAFQAAQAGTSGEWLLQRTGWARA